MHGGRPHIIQEPKNLLQLEPEIFEHILKLVIENDPDPVGNLAKIQMICKQLARFLSQEEVKRITGLSESDLYLKLYYAIKDLDTQKVPLFVNFGGLRKSEQDNILFDALFYAALSQDPLYYQKLLHIIPILEKAGGNWRKNTSKGGSSPLATAVIMNKTPLVKLLLEHGAQPTEEAVKRAVMHDNFEVTELLFKHGAHTTRSLLHDIFLRDRDPKFLKLFIRYGANINQTDEYGRTLIDIAPSCQVAQILFQAGSIPPSIDRLSSAIWENNEGLVQLFIDNGADVNGTSPNTFHPMPPLAYAKTAGMAKILLKAGAQLFINCEGSTPIEILVKRAIRDKDPMILVEVLRQRYPHQAAAAIATVLIAGASLTRAVCTVL